MLEQDRDAPLMRILFLRGGRPDLSDADCMQMPRVASACLSPARLSQNETNTPWYRAMIEVDPA